MIAATRTAEALANATRRYWGQRLLGIVDGNGCVELVFSERLDRGNLLTVWIRDDGRIIQIAHGFVADAAGYARCCSVGADTEAA